MFGRISHRRHAADVRDRFVMETVDALHALHRRVWDIEEQMQQQEATNRELERHTARAQAEASVARLELRELVREHPRAREESFGAGPSRELLDDLLLVPASM